MIGSSDVGRNMVSPITLSSTEYILLAAMWPDSCRTSPHQPLPYRVRNMSSGGGYGSGVAVGSGIRVGLGVGVLLMTIVGLLSSRLALAFGCFQRLVSGLDRAGI